jgi:hypothetical protein
MQNWWEVNATIPFIHVLMLLTNCEKNRHLFDRWTFTVQTMLEHSQQRVALGVIGDVKCLMMVAEETDKWPPEWQDKMVVS